MNVVRRLSVAALRLAGLLAIVYACTATAADPSKVLRVAQGDVDTLDPHQWVDYFSGWVGVAIFESLYEWDYLARPVRLAPNTAAALPKISEDGRTWTISLKPSIYFTEDPAFGGKPRELTAEDYVYAFKRRLDPHLRPGGLVLLTDALVGGRAAVDAARKPGAKFDYDAPIEGLRALDRYTLQLRLNQPSCDGPIGCFCSFGLRLRDWKVRPIPHLSGAQPNEHSQECPTHARPSNRNGAKRR